MTDAPEKTIVLGVSHGTDDPIGQATVLDLLAAIEAASTYTLHSAFVDVQEPRLDTAIGELPAVGGIVVPLLLSRGFHVDVDVAERSTARPTTVGTPLGPDPRIAKVLRARLEAAGYDASAGRAQPVILAAAGSNRASARADCERAAELFAAELGHEVTLAYLAHATPSLADALAQTAQGGGFVVPYLLAPGVFATRIRALGEQAGWRVAATVAAPGDIPELVVEVALDRITAAR